MKNSPAFARAIAPVLPEALESRRLMSSTLWEIHGDTNADNKSDVIRVDVSPDDPARLRATVNGEVVSTKPRARAKSIRVLAGDGDDLVTIDLGSNAGKARVRVLAGTGNDSVTVKGAVADLYGGTGDDTLVSGAAPDHLDGEAGDDQLVGGAGRDVVVGGAGDDTLAGGTGADVLNGGDGEDELFGAEGNDSLLAGGGEDTLNGGDGADMNNSGAGRDKVYSNGRPDRSPKKKDTQDLVLADTSDAAFMGFADEGALNAWLIDAAARRWQDVFGQPYFPIYYGWVPRDYVIADGGVIQAGALAPAASDSKVLETAAPVPAGPGGGTNTQVAGVDEADIVETDGRYVYTASGTTLTIVSADPADDLVITSQTDVGGNIRGLYLFGSRVTVISETYSWQETGGSSARLVGWMRPMDVKVVVTTYDVSKPASPGVVERTEMEGSYVDSRSVDGRAYVVVRNGVSFPRPEAVTVDGDNVFESEAAYRARLANDGVALAMPQFSATAGGVTRTGSLVSAGDLYVSSGDDIEPEFTSVMLIDPSAGQAGPDASATVVGPAGEVFATAESMYVSAWAWDEDTGDEQTNLAKFHLGTDAVTLEAVGTVGGSIIDQFSMGEHDGNLQIATTRFSGTGTVSSVYVMDEEADRLEPIGAITGIAPGERIFSSRFIGDEGYLVTYRQVDPLFTLDLSNPLAPKIAGELKVPGFSRYLQPVSDQYLLGLGHAGTDTGGTGGLQLSLFDVADPANPSLVTSFLFTGMSPTSSSSAEYDHHAIQYFADLGLITLPVWNYDWEAGTSKRGIAVVKLDLSAGTMTQVGFIDQTEAERTVRVGDALVAVGRDKVISVEAADPTHVLDTLELPDSGSDPIWYFPLPVDVVLF